MHLTRQQYFSKRVLSPRTNILSNVKCDFLTLPPIHTRGSNTKSKLIKKKKKILRSTYQQFPAKTDLSEVPWNQSPVSGLMVSIFTNCLSAMGRGTQTLNLQVTLPQNCKNTK